MAAILGGLRQRVIKAISDHGEGSFLRGWRVYLDPDGSLDVTFLDFCKAASRLRLHDVDATLLFGEDSPGEMTLSQLHPEMGKLVQHFRHWMMEHFGGPSEMFTMLEPQNGEGKISRRDFIKGILEEGFDTTPDLVGEIFNLLDFQGVGRLEMAELMFLDLDPKIRQGAIRKMQSRARAEYEHMLAENHREVHRQNYPIGHRLAPRGWHAPSVEKLPEVALARRKVWRDREHQRRSHAWFAFQHHMEKTYGSGIRAWRKGLDPGGTFGLTRGRFWQYCRRLNLEFDYRLLWQYMDHDFSGILRMEEVSPVAASALAGFWSWATVNYGSCLASWSSIMKAAKPPSSWKSITSLKHTTFLDAIEALGWTKRGVETAGTQLSLALDLDGCGIISRSDLEWLDGWQAPEWLYSAADKDAWLQLSRMLLKRSQSPLKAWRQMDQDDSNCASWDEFVELCNFIGFEGNRGGAWRYLDRDISGTISMKEWHREGADLLKSFKEFVDLHYGSARLAIERMDSDNSGSVTYSELKRACKRRGWEGDCKMLFNCLDIDVVPGLRSFSYKDVAFLDTWEPALDEAFFDEDEVKSFMPKATQLSSATSDGFDKVPTSTSTRRFLAGGMPEAVSRAKSTTSLAPLLDPSPTNKENLRKRDVPNGGDERPDPTRPPRFSLLEREDLRDIPVPTAAELIRDAVNAERQETEALLSRRPVVVSVQKVRKPRGVGCLRTEALEHMKKELKKINSINGKVNEQRLGYRAQALAWSCPSLPKAAPAAPRPKIGKENSRSNLASRESQLTSLSVSDSSLRPGSSSCGLPEASCQAAWPSTSTSPTASGGTRPSTSQYLSQSQSLGLSRSQSQSEQLWDRPWGQGPEKSGSIGGGVLKGGGPALAPGGGGMDVMECSPTSTPSFRHQHRNSEDLIVNEYDMDFESSPVAIGVAR